MQLSKLIHNKIIGIIALHTLVQNKHTVESRTLLFLKSVEKTMFQTFHVYLLTVAASWKGFLFSKVQTRLSSSLVFVVATSVWNNYTILRYLSIVSVV